jgi:hypothetical protein
MFSAFSIKRVLRFPLGANLHQYAARLIYSIGIVLPSPSLIRIFEFFTREAPSLSSAALLVSFALFKKSSLKSSSRDYRTGESFLISASSSVKTAENRI